jgi:hypothetical protein
VSGSIPQARVGIVGSTPGYILDSYLRSTASVLGAAGSNTGNLAFQYAVDRTIASTKTYVHASGDPAWVRERCDVLVFPSANLVNSASDKLWLSTRADFIEAAGLPCIAVGIGAQAPTQDTEITLTARTLRYLQTLSEHSRSIGVRGDYTASVLAKFGIKNTVVIGCPSNFLHPSPTLGLTIAEKLGRQDFERVIMTDIERKVSHRDLDRKLFGWIVRSNGTYVCQSESVLIAQARGRRDEIDHANLADLRQHLGLPSETPGLTPQSPEPAAHRLRAFFDVGAWLEFMASVDLAIGVRFHGNLLAVQAGTPGISIVHDARTQELCDTTGVPHVSIEQFMAAERVQDVARSADFDGALYDARRTSLARAYCTLLADQGVAVTSSLNKLIE